MADPLLGVLTVAEHPRPAVTVEDARWWPRWAVPALERADALAPDGPVASVACDECGVGHVERVEAVDTPGRPRRWFHPCPALGRAEVKPERLRRWVVRPTAVAAALSGREGAERLAGRVWHLGPIGPGWVGWLAAGWRGEVSLTERVPELVQPTAAVFVPHTLPPMGVWGRSAPRRVVPLSAVLTLSADGLTVDPVALAAHLGPPDGDDPPAEPVVLPPDPAGGPRVRLPAGTAWEEVAVEVDDHHLLVRSAGGEWRVGYEAAGFADRRSDAPNQQWELLKLLAKRGGELDDGDGKRTKSDRLTRAVSDLRVALARLTGLTADPFHPTPRGRPYRTRFRIRAAFARPSDG